MPLNQWLQVVHMMVSSKKGVSSHQVMRTLEVQYKTAWFMTHRIRLALSEPGYPHGGKLGGESETLEADETFVGGKAKNRADGPIPPKQSVFSLVQPKGRVRSFHVPSVAAHNLAPIIAQHAHVDSRFMTDEADMYARPGTWFIDHKTVNHSAGIMAQTQNGTPSPHLRLSLPCPNARSLLRHVRPTAQARSSRRRD